jgi:hypothetical protein
MIGGALDCLGLDCKFVDTALESTGAETIFAAPI